MGGTETILEFLREGVFMIQVISGYKAWMFFIRVVGNGSMAQVEGFIFRMISSIICCTTSVKWQSCWDIPHCELTVGAGRERELENSEWTVLIVALKKPMKSLHVLTVVTRLGLIYGHEKLHVVVRTFVDDAWVKLWSCCFEGLSIKLLLFLIAILWTVRTKVLRCCSSARPAVFISCSFWEKQGVESEKMTVQVFNGALCV